MYIISFDVGIKNLAYTILEYNNSNMVGKTRDKYDVLSRSNVLLWNKVDLSSNKYDLEKITENLLEVLDCIAYNDIENLHDAKIHVVIENQPALKSPIMKNIQIIIYSYFKTIAKYNNLDLCTRLISAKSKLKYIESFPEFEGSDPNKKGYAKNKSDSIAFTRWLLDEKAPNVKASEVLAGMKKKDDICDSYLQALYYVNNVV